MPPVLPGESPEARRERYRRMLENPIMPRNRIVQVLEHDGLGPSYLPRKLLVLREDGTIWEGRAHQERWDDNRATFKWEQVNVPPFEEE